VPITFMEGTQISGANSAITQFLIQVNTACGTAVPCNATNPADGNYAGTAFSAWNASLPVNSGAAIGTAQSFFRAYGVSDLEGDPVVVNQYASLFGDTVVNLSTGGLLTFTTPVAGAPIPLPAAVWLLLSGLAGLGVVGRRRTTAAA